MLRQHHHAKFFLYLILFCDVSKSGSGQYYYLVIVVRCLVIVVIGHPPWLPLNSISFPSKRITKILCVTTYGVLNNGGCFLKAGLGGVTVGGAGSSKTGFTESF